MSVAMSNEDTVLEDRLLEIAAEGAEIWMAHGATHAVVDGWSVATQGHYFVAVARELLRVLADGPKPKMVEYARKLIALTPHGVAVPLAALRRWIDMGHCLTCGCRPDPPYGKLFGALVQRHLVFEALKCLPGETVLVAPSGAPDMVKPDPLCTGGSHVVFFGDGWRVLLMACRDGEPFVEFPVAEATA